MKNALKLSAVFLLLTLGCDLNDGSSFEILVENKHPDSKYRVVLEDYTYYVWASSYEDETFSPICNCFLWTIKEPSKEDDMPAPFNGKPPISVKYASKDAFIERVLKESI